MRPGMRFFQPWRSGMAVRDEIRCFFLGGWGSFVFHLWPSFRLFLGLLGTLLKTILQVSLSPESPEAYRVETATDEKLPNDLFELV
jgi:hypothetical protein